MPEYEVTLVEVQVSKRPGLTRITADTPELAQRLALTEPPDDELIHWKDWTTSESWFEPLEDKPPKEVVTHVEGVLARYAASHQREPLISVLALADSPQGRLELAVGLHDHELGLFLDGVPVDAYHDDLCVEHGSYGSAVLYIQNFLSNQYAEDMERLLRVVDSPSATHLCAVLAGAEAA